jgi:hypothetical protein
MVQKLSSVNVPSIVHNKTRVVLAHLFTSLTLFYPFKCMDGQNLQDSSVSCISAKCKKSVQAVAWWSGLLSLPPPPPFQGPVTAIFTYFILMGERGGGGGEGADSFTTTNSFPFLAKNLQICPLSLSLFLCMRAWGEFWQLLQPRTN